MALTIPAVAVIAASLALSGCTGKGPARLSAVLPVTAQDDRLGGLSALELSADGVDFTALGDRGLLVTGQLDRAADGTLTGLRDLVLAALPAAGGGALPADLADSEGLATDGATLFVAFEGDHRVVAHPRQGTPRRLPTSPDWAALPGNGGIEALAIDAQGRLLALPERSGAVTAPFPVWRLEDGAWRQVAALPRSAGFLPVGADMGPDGRLYVLERSFDGLSFRSRVRRLDLDSGRTDTLLVTSRFRHGNLEGLAVTDAPGGGLRLTMISDDNFHPLLRSEIVEYVITDALASERRSQ